MWNFLRAGGLVPMAFILIFGFVGLAAGFFFAVRADKRTLGFVKGMMAATLFATLAASCADVGATLYACERTFSAAESEADAIPRAMHLVAEGFAESTSPGIMGFSFLALTAMLGAVGRRRLDERLER